MNDKEVSQNANNWWIWVESIQKFLLFLQFEITSKYKGKQVLPHL